MDIDESITVAKINTPNGRFYLLVGWQTKSFEMYLYTKEQLWRGKFSSNRLTGFCRNLHMSESEYYENAKRCLSQQIEDYQYELKSGFFYWKKKYKDSIVMEGFLPMDLDESPANTRPDLLEILLVLNKYMKKKVDDLKQNYTIIRNDYFKCLKDTEEFLNLKIEMERTLCDKFLHLLSLKRTEVEALDKTKSKTYDVDEGDKIHAIPFNLH